MMAVLALCVSMPAAAKDEQGQLDAARQRAIDQVVRSARSEDQFLRANAIEAAQHLPDRIQPMVQLALDDESPVVRFAALVTVGQLKLEHLAPTAEALMQDRNEIVRMAATFAAHQCGREVDISPMAGWIASHDPSVRRNAVMLVGMMGEMSAVPMILDNVSVPIPRESAIHNALARIQAAEAIALLTADTRDPRMRDHEAQALNALRAGVYSSEDEVRVMSVLILARVGDRSMRPAVELLLEEPPIELQLAAAQYLAQTGQPVGVNLVIGATQSDMATVRAQAAMTLGYIDQPRARQAMVALLEDSSEIVRLSAAAAVLGRPAAPIAQIR